VRLMSKRFRKNGNFSAEESCEILELIAEHQTDAVLYLSGMYGVSPSEILEIISNQLRSNPGTELKPSFVIEMYRKGASFSQLDRVLEMRVGTAALLVHLFLKSEAQAEGTRRKSKFSDTELFELYTIAPLENLQAFSEDSSELKVIAYLASKNASYRQIASLLDVTQELIMLSLQMRGITLKAGRKSSVSALTPDEVREIHDLYLRELKDSVSTVAKELDIKPSVLFETDFVKPSDEYVSENILSVMFKVLEDVQRLYILLLRQHGLSYSEIAEYNTAFTKFKQPLPLSLIHRVLHAGFPQDIPQTIYEQASRDVVSLLESKGFLKRSTEPTPSVVEIEAPSQKKVSVLSIVEGSLLPRHLNSELLDITVADVEYITYLNTRYQLNVYEISDFVYRSLTAPAIRDVLVAANVKPKLSRSLSNYPEAINLIETLRVYKEFSVDRISYATGIRPEKVMFFIDLRKMPQSHIKVYNSQEVWTGEISSFVDPVRNISGLTKIEFVESFVNASQKSVAQVMSELGLKRIHPTLTLEDLRTILYINNIPVRLDLEFPEKLVAENIIPSIKANLSSLYVPISPISRSTLPRKIVLPAVEQIVTTPAVTEVIRDKKLYPLDEFPSISIMDIERIIDLHQTFEMSAEEIRFHEIYNISPEEIVSIFELVGVPYDSHVTTLTEERLSRMRKNLSRVGSIEQLSSVHNNVPVEKLKLLIRRRKIDSKKPEITFDFRKEAKSYLGLSEEKIREVCEAYKDFKLDSAAIAVLFDLESRKDVRRILHENSVPLRLEEETSVIEGLEEYGI